ncbi:MAG TPA: ABC transporter substrate-binding protein [Solirubrobacteraceae bacterium]|jgi:multiple sugar transport system substrate-binding protein
MRVKHLLALFGACALLAAGCGSDDGGGGGGGGGASGDTGQTKGAKAVDPAAADSAKGEATYCTGKDTSGDLIQGVKDFNKANPGIKIKLLEFPESADEQRNQFIQRQRAKSSDCDGFESDVVWTAEFASQKWLQDMTSFVEKRKSEFVPSTLSSVTYENKIWGVPRVSDAGLLYYRTDEVDQVPATWQEVYAKAKEGKGIVYQGASYEGLTVNFLELAFAAGGSILSEDGKKATIDSPENLKALQFMVDGIKDGAAPKAVTTYMEEEARRTFESGKATFERQWPYAYALGNAKGSGVKGKFAVAPYPPFEGGGKAAILGGHNMVMSTYSKNPGAMLKFIDYMTSPEVMKSNAVKYSKTPVLTETYADPDVKKALPFADQLKQAVEQAKSRPVSPVYSQISQAIYKNVNAALSGATDPQSALKKAQSDIDKALATF